MRIVFWHKYLTRHKMARQRHWYLSRPVHSFLQANQQIFLAQHGKVKGLGFRVWVLMESTVAVLGGHLTTFFYQEAPALPQKTGSPNLYKGSISRVLIIRQVEYGDYLAIYGLHHDQTRAT